MNQNLQLKPDKSEYSIEIDIFYSLFELLSYAQDYSNYNLVPNFWINPTKTKIKKTFVLNYIQGNNMISPEHCKDYLIQQANYISSLSFDDYLLSISHLTSTKTFIESYLHTTLKKESEITVTKGITNDDSTIIVYHSNTPVKIFKSLWVLLYSIMIEDELFNLPSLEEFLTFLSTNDTFDLEKCTSHYSTKELKISQIRFTAIDIERKLVQTYIDKFNNIIMNSPIYKYKLYLFTNIQHEYNNNLFYKDDNIFYTSTFLSFSFQQKLIYIPTSNIDNVPAKLITISNKQRFKLFPDANIVKNQQITDRGVYSISTPKASFNTTSLINHFATKHKIYINTIVEGAAGLGGNLLNFSTVFKNVIGIECDHTTFLALKNNCDIYKKTLPKKYKANIELIEDTILKAVPIIDTKYKIDAIFMSPPWGGINYTNASNITYYLDNKPLWIVIEYLLSYTQLIYLDLGKNININELISHLKAYTIEVIDRTSYAYLVCIYSKKPNTKKDISLQKIQEELNITNISNNNTNSYIESDNNNRSVLLYKECHSLCLDLLLPNTNNLVSIQNIVLPISTVFNIADSLHLKLFNYIIYKTDPFPSKEYMFSLFASYFESDLLGWKEKNSPHWIVKGGFNIKQLLGHKYNDKSGAESIKTKDIDLNISIKDNTFRQKYLEYIIKKCYSFFIHSSYYFLFNIQLISFKPPSYNWIEKNNLYHLILISYQNSDWIDIGFVDYTISENMIDWSISYKVGFPIKTADTYMDEIVKLVYQSNVKDIDNFTYRKRNPNKGSLFKKGIQDLERSIILCELDHSIYEDYEEYCHYLMSTSKDNVKNGNVALEFLQHYFRKKRKQLK